MAGKLTTDNILVETTATLGGEIKGDKFLLCFSSLAVGIPPLLKVGTSSTLTLKSLPMLRAGSITGISIEYDQGAIPALGGVTLIVYVNSTAVWSNALTNSIASGKRNVFTQSRGTDSFSAGEVILVGVSSYLAQANINDVCVIVEGYYDA